jgi:hypothetical protein
VLCRPLRSIFHNVSKTKELRVGFSKLIPSFARITIRGQQVDVVSEAKLLGVVLSDDLKWNRHIDYIHLQESREAFVWSAPS